MPIDLATLASSAGVSLFVTVAVEYAAKPRLEARKERILDAHRARRELLAATVRIVYAAGTVASEIPASADAAVRGNIHIEQDRQHERLQEEIRQLVDDVGRRAATYPDVYLNLVVGYTSAVNGILMSARDRPGQAAAIRDVSAAMGLVLSPPRLWQVWRMPGYRQAMIEAQRLVSGYIGAGT